MSEPDGQAGVMPGPWGDPLEGLKPVKTSCKVDVREGSGIGVGVGVGEGEGEGEWRGRGRR